MSQPAITAENVGKSYRIGQNAKHLPSFREALVESFRIPLRRLQGQGGNRTKETFWALKDVSFKVQPGEVVGIIGRNGAGKSTLLKILSRITNPTEGTVRLRGRVASLLEVGTGFHLDLSGRENIYLNGSILGMKRAEIDRRFDEIVEFAEISRFLDTQVKRYSSGMFVRLAFAVAAHLEPEILIVDEVLAVGDAAFQRKCLGKMQTVSASEGRTVLFVSHNLATVRSLCARAIWLKHGNVIQDGPVGPVVESYLGEILGDNCNVFDVDQVDRSSWLASRLRLRRVEFNGGNPIRHGLPLQIDFEYQTMANIEGASFGVGFSSIDGNRIMSSDSDIPGERFDIAAETIGRIRLTIPELQLQPGRYFLDIGARSGENSNLDSLPCVAQVEVLPGPDTPTILVGRNVTGGVRVPAECQHIPVGTALTTSNHHAGQGNAWN
jgi:lipopolysaccharide transport system ATP-binding protein